MGQVRDPRVSSCQGSRIVQADATTQMVQLGQRPKKLQAWAGHEGSLVVPGSSLAPSHLPLAGDNPLRTLQMVRGIPSSSLPAHILAARWTWDCYVILRKRTCSSERTNDLPKVTKQAGGRTDLSLPPVSSKYQGTMLPSGHWLRSQRTQVESGECASICWGTLARSPALLHLRLLICTQRLMDSNIQP